MLRVALPACTAASLITSACTSSGGTPTTRDASTPPGVDASSSSADEDAATMGDMDARVSLDAHMPGGDGGRGPLPDASLTPGDAGAPATLARTFVFVGGYDWGATTYPFRSFTLNRTTGALTQVGDPTDLGANPSYIAPSRDGRFLYVANERDDDLGGITVAEINRASGAVTNRDHVTTGVAFVFSSLDPAERFVLAAAYNAGNVTVFPIGNDRTLGDAVDTEAFGSGAQTHSVRVHPSSKWVFAPNKARDEIAQLTFDADTGALDTNSAGGARDTEDGSGPRHIALAPSGTRAFVMFENSSEVASYDIEANGTLTELDRTSSLPAGFSGGNTGAHVLVHPDGRYVYASNRGHDSIAVFSVAADGGLTLLENEDTRGATPRNFDIDERGELMVVANQNEGNLAVFRIGNDGRLSPLGDTFEGLPEPAAVSIVNVYE